MRKTYLITFILITIVLVISFSNCGKSNLSKFASNTTDSSNEPPAKDSKSYNLTCVPSKPLSKMAQKHNARPALIKTSEDFLMRGISVGEEISVTLNLSCLSSVDQSQDLFTEEYYKKNPEILNQSSITFLYKVEHNLSPQELEIEINKSPCLISVYPNAKISLLALAPGAPNDPRYIDQNYLKSIKHDVIYKQIFNPSNGINQTVKVAVIDTGIDVNHPDLRPNLIFNSETTILGFNAIDNNNLVQDALFHGSHVSGIVAATSNNSNGISGVLGQNIKLLPIRVSTDGQSINSAATVNGIRWAADQGADVINMSLGGPNPSPDMKLAIEYAVSKGVVVVVAAGNNGFQLNSTNSIYPAKWGSSIEGMLTAGSIDATTLARSSFSNYSPTFVEIMAPGSDGTKGILSTVPTNLSSTGYANTVNGGPIHGTSMASPVVAGTAAMLIALAKSRGYKPLPDQIERLIKKGAGVISALSTFVEGGRHVDLQSMISMADQEMKISSLSTTGRFTGSGVINIQQNPTEQKVKVNDPLKLEVKLATTSSILVNYQWYRNKIPIAGANKPTYNESTTTAQSGGSYFVEMKTGTTVVRSATVDVFTAPEYCP